jgi:hypothetical protein
METALRLLMRDGALRIAFHPRLTAEQYGELLETVNTATTKAELERAVETLAARWGHSVEVDSVLAADSF